MFTEFKDASGILQDMYKGFKNQMDREMPELYKLLKPSADKVVGQQVKFSAQLENPQGFGSRLTASQYLPTAVPGKYIELAIGTGRIYAVSEFDRKMLKAAGQNAEGKRAFINYLENELKGIKNSVIFDISRQLFGKKTGFLTKCAATVASLTLVLDAATNMEYVVEGQHIDVLSLADGTPVANGSDRVIQSVDVDNHTVTLDAAGGVVTADDTVGITRQGSYNAEMTGLSAIVSDTEDIYNISTAAQRRWKAYVASATGAFSIEKVIKAGMAAKIRSGAKVDLIVSNSDLQAQYWFQLTGTRTFNVANAPIPVQKLSTGFYALEVIINGRPVKWIADDNCPSGELYGLSTEDIGIQHLGDMEFMNVGGEILLPNIYSNTGTPTNKAVLEYYPELVCTRRNSHFRMTGITKINGW